MSDKHFCVQRSLLPAPAGGSLHREDSAGIRGGTLYQPGPRKFTIPATLPNARAGNFEKISFNFGSTLTNWMALNHSETLQEIIRQENAATKKLGVSNGMAQPYFHIIMPLSNRRDKTTLVRWGLKDYERLFGHKPQGMWLPETAVDLESLDVLAKEGMLFTILAPWQAARADLDITRPYRIDLPSGRSIAVFFYNSFLSGEISFNPAATEKRRPFRA